MTGAGGDGGPRGIFLFVLKRGGSMGSFCTSTIRMILCLAPELNATPCCDGVYLQQKKNMAHECRAKYSFYDLSK